jgi:hypothetical protein
MPVRPAAHVFRALNSSPRVQDTGTHEKTQLVRNHCPNHEYRSRTIRRGKIAELCALCINQREMAERWKNIRKALATIRCSIRKSSAAAKPASVSRVEKARVISTNVTAISIIVRNMRVVVTIN